MVGLVIALAHAAERIERSVEGGSIPHLASADADRPGQSPALDEPVKHADADADVLCRRRAAEAAREKARRQRVVPGHSYAGL